MEKPVNSSGKSEKKGISPVKSIAAIIFGIVYIVVLLLIGKFPIVLPIALSFLIILAEREYTALVANKGIKTERISLLFFSLYFVWLEFFHLSHEDYFKGFGNNFSIMWVTSVFFIIFFVPILCFIKTKQIPDFMNIFATLFGILYIGYLFSFMIRLFFLGEINILILLTIVTWASDVGGYLVGATLKGPKLIPVISPGKTLSGMFGGIIFCFIALYIYMGFISIKIPGGGIHSEPNWTLTKEKLGVSILFYFAALYGDLFESAMKRYFGVKDTGGLIPEHGGIMDRFDSMLFVAPVMYGIFLWIQLRYGY